MSVVIELPDLLAAGPVALRPLRSEDADPYAAAFVEDPEMGRLLGVEHDPLPPDVLARVEGAQTRALEGRGVELAACEPDGGGFLGSVMLHSFAWRHRRCEVGFFMAPSARGRGVGRAAVTRAVAWAFADLGIERMDIATTPDNSAVRKFALHIGFEEEGLLRKRNVERGRRVDFVVFGALAEEWRARRGEDSRS